MFPTESIDTGLYDLKSLFDDKRLLLKSYTKYSTLSFTGLKDEVIVVFGITATSAALIVCRVRVLGFILVILTI